MNMTGVHLVVNGNSNVMVYVNSGLLPPLQESEEKCNTNKQIPVLFTPLTTTLLYCCRWHCKVKEVGHICLALSLSLFGL